MKFLSINIVGGGLKAILIGLTVTCLALSCVSQKPKPAAATEAATPDTQTEAVQTQSPDSGESVTKTASTTGSEANQSAVPATPTASATEPEKPAEVLAMYKKPPSLKTVMAVLLLPSVLAPSTVAQSKSPVPAPQATLVPQTAPAAQTAPATQNTAGSTQNQTSQASATAAQPSAPSATQGQAGSASAKPPSTNANTGKPQVVQPSVPNAPASGTAAITAVPASPVPSYELSVQKNQTFTVSLPGNGWIYLGDELNRQGIRYESRQLVDNTVIYRLSGDRTGEFLLRFQRDNPVTQAPEFQYVKVTVGETGASASATATPSSAAALATTGSTGSTPTTGTTNQPGTASTGVSPGTPGSTGASGSTMPGTAGNSGASVSSGSTGIPGSQTPTAPGTTGTGSSVGAAGSTAATGTPGATGTGVTSASAMTSPTTTQTVPSRDSILSMTDASQVLDLARSQLAQKQIPTVLSALERYLVLSPAGSDEALYLYALAYEQDTPYRDIQKSYQYYKQLVREYPLSVYRQYALERIAYLERYYPGLR